MKVGYYQGQQRRIDAYSEFSQLWKVDDKEWIEARKSAWRKGIFGDGGHPTSLLIGKFYVYGEEPPGYIGDNLAEGEKVRFEFGHRLAYTPFENAEQVKRFWEVRVALSVAGAELDHSAIASVGGWLDKMPERDRMVKLITETLYSTDYFMLKDPERGRRLITKHPRGFVVGYAGLSSCYHKDYSHNKWCYQNFCFDLFMKSVRYCDEHNELKVPVHKKALPQMYVELLKQDDSSLNEYRLELKTRLIAAAEADDAPDLLRQALNDAREMISE